jgi:hypothetical protein
LSSAHQRPPGFRKITNAPGLLPQAKADFMNCDQWRKEAQELVASILQIRRHRAEVFGSDLFSDPAWDILLELFAAELAKRRVTLRDLCAIGPQSTIARWVAALEQKGLIVCEVNPLHPDQFWIELSTNCAAKMAAFLNGERFPLRFG